MRLRYSDGTSSEDCGHADDDPKCLVNQVTITNGDFGEVVTTSKGSYVRPFGSGEEY